MKRKLLPLIVGAMLSTSNAWAQQPCPFVGDACDDWNKLVEKLEQAEARADKAEQALVAKANRPPQPGNELIDEMLKLAPGIDLSKSYTSEQKGDSYVLRFDPLGGIPDMPDISVVFAGANFEVSPHLKPDHFWLKGTLGDTVEVLDDGDMMAELTIAEQKIEWIWDNKNKHYPKSDMDLKSLVLNLPDQPGVATIAQVLVKNDTIDEGDNKFRIDQEFSASSIVVTAPMPVFIDNIRAGADISGSDFEKVAATFTAFSGMGLDEDSDPAEVAATLRAILDNLSAYRSDFEVSGITVGSKEAPMASVGRLYFDSRLQESGKGTGEFLQLIEFSDVESDFPMLPSGLLPRKMKLDLAIEKIPASLADDFIQSVGSMDMEMNTIDESLAVAQGAAMNNLMQSDMQIKLNSSYLHADDAKIDVSLDSRVTPGSAMGGTADFNMRIQGLQTIIDTVTEFGGPEAAGPLTMLTLFSERSQENGVAIDTYAFKLDKDGAMTLNGKDLSGLMGGM